MGPPAHGGISTWVQGRMGFKSAAVVRATGRPAHGAKCADRHTVWDPRVGRPAHGAVPIALIQGRARQQ